MKNNSIKIELISAEDAKAKGLTPSASYYMVLDGPITSALTGAEDPTEATEGQLGQFYVNSTTGDTFICTAIVDGTYTWKQLQFSE